MAERTWPHGGYSSGWCLTDEHQRCRMDHGDQAGACHCPACAAPPLDAAAASPADEPDAAAATPSVPRVEMRNVIVEALSRCGVSEWRVLVCADTVIGSLTDAGLLEEVAA